MAPSVAQLCLDYKKQSGMNIVGFGFNCVPPEDIVTGLQAIADDERLTNSLRERVGSGWQPTPTSRNSPGSFSTRGTAPTTKGRVEQDQESVQITSSTYR